MTTVLLGNTAPLLPNGDPANIGNTITVVEMRDGFDDKNEAGLALSTDNDPVLTIIREALPQADLKYAVGVAEVNDLWSASHSSDPPEWIESDDREFARVLAHWFSKASHKAAKSVDILGLLARPVTSATLSTWLGARDHVCKVGRPDGWVSVADVPPLGGGAYGTEYDPRPDDLWAFLKCRELLTNVGRDALHDQHLKISSQPVGFGYMALANNATATAEAATDTALTGEITTAGGGLIRAAATYAHTVGATTSTMTKTFTANGSDSLPVTVSQIGLFNATPTGGTMGYKKAFTPTATLSASGDNVTITWTLTGS